jgi:predicted  nucleic acid-binding Zn ribbon protein
MFVAEISWQISAESTPDRLDDISYSLLAYLRKNGQIVNWDWPISISGDRLKTVEMMLEADSLDLKYANKYVIGEIDRAIKVYSIAFQSLEPLIPPEK